jgi:fumarate hydratase subunit alpha
MKELNENGQGAQALGGKTTVLDVFIETVPCHIASLPVSVCINCHAARHKSEIL